MTLRMGWYRGQRVIRRMNNKPAWATIGGKRKHYDSQLEIKWACYNQILKTTGHCAEWEREPHVFYFKNVRRGAVQFTPDFLITLPNGDQVYQEVKGRLESNDITKLKRLAKDYPKVKIELWIQRFDKSNYARRKVAEKYCSRVGEVGKVLERFGNIVKTAGAVIETKD